MELPINKYGVKEAILPQSVNLTQVLNIQSCHARLILKQVEDKLCKLEFICNKGNRGEG